MKKTILIVAMLLFIMLSFMDIMLISDVNINYYWSSAIRCSANYNCTRAYTYYYFVSEVAKAS